LAKIYLERSGEFSVDIDTSAKKAIGMLRERGYDAIISDFQMPEMNGIQFLKKIRTSGNTVPFIIFTGRGREEIVIQALNEGADSYIQKGGESKAQFTELAHKIRQSVQQRRAEINITDLKRREADIINFLPDATFAIDTHGVVIAWNRAMEKMTGIRATQILEKGDYEYALPFYRERRPILIDLVLRDDPATTVKYQNLIRDQKNLIAEVTIPHFNNGKGASLWFIASPLYDTRGTIIGAIESIRDITARKQAEKELLRKNEELQAAYEELTTAEEELRQNYDEMRKSQAELRLSEERYRNVVEDQTEFICRFTPDGTHVFVNEAYCRYFGLKHDEILGHRFRPKIPTEDRERVIRFFTSLTPDHPVDNIEHRIIMPDGAIRWQWWSDRAIFDSSGTVTEYQSVGRDITEQKQAENSLMTSQTILTDAMDLAHLANWEYDDQNGMFIFDDRFYALCGTTAEREGGYQIPADVYFREFVHPDDRGRIIEEVERNRKTSDRHHVSQFEHRILRRDGEIRYIIVRSESITDDEGHVIKIHGVNQDITERKRAQEDLRESENKYRTIFENTGTATVLLNENTIISIANTEFEQLSGYLREELEGKKSWTEFVVKEDLEKMLAQHRLRREKQEAASKHYEFRFVTKTGEIRNIFLTIEVIPGTKQAVASLMDITERKKADEALKDSVLRLSEIISFLPDATFAIDKNGIVMSWNRAMEEMTGVPEEQILGKGNYEYAVPFYGTRRPVLVDLVFCPKDEISENYSYVEVNEDVLTAETVNASPLGKNVVLWGKAAPLYDREGNVTGAIESIRDITDRKRAEESLKSSEERYRTLLQRSFDAVVVHRNGIVTLANQGAATLLGALSPSDLIGKNVLDFVHPTSKDIVRKRVSAMTGGDVITAVDAIEEKFMKIDGKVIDVEVVATGFIDDGKPAIQVVFRDISERRKLMEALHEAIKKLNLLTSIMRHDITNQLTIMNGHLALLETKLPDNSFGEHFKKINTSAQRISSIIRFTKEYEQIGVNFPVWQDARTIVDTAAKDLLLGQVVVKNDLPTGMEVFADLLIVKVFYNLIDNAVRHGEKITTIKFSAEERGNDTIVMCEDDGVGVPADEKEKIFERGFGKNTGLGLFLTRKILDITGITISETGEPGKGARFEITVPKGAYRI